MTIEDLIEIRARLTDQASPAAHGWMMMALELLLRAELERQEAPARLAKQQAQAQAHLQRATEMRQAAQSAGHPADCECPTCWQNTEGGGR